MITLLELQGGIKSVAMFCVNIDAIVLRLCDGRQRRNLIINRRLSVGYCKTDAVKSNKMATIKLSIEIDFESWFSKHREPKTKEDWQEFFETHFRPESSVLGVDDGENQDMIAMNSLLVCVTECSTCL